MKHAVAKVPDCQKDHDCIIKRMIQLMNPKEERRRTKKNQSKQLAI
jgi:hypothetical protein